MTDTTELSKAYEPTEVEARRYAFWLERNYFRAEAPSDKPPFSIVLPPPNVTGSLHIGHALTATIQDILTRWKRMSGFNALWLPGTDHAGIATQMVVEKELKKTEGKSRHDLGREAFLERVWEWKGKFGDRIGEQHRYLGASLDWSRERFTMDEQSSAAVREVFVRLYEEGLMYRAQKLINWCPSCRTALSDLEVEHQEKNGSIWHIRYPVKDSDRTLTVATTRPETMLGDTAVAVHPEDERYQDLIGKHVVLPLSGREIPIIADGELVDPKFGTGVVKVTPAHDFNDYQTGLRHKLPMLSILDDAARMTKETGKYTGTDRFDARKQVLADLQELGLLEKEEPHKLSVGTCQRCTTVVEPRLSPQWFVKIEPLAKPAIEAVEQGRTKFVPESWTNTYFHWMRNIHDWCVSRQLWWGHQIPAYYCTACSPRLGDDTDLPLDAATVKVGGVDFARAEPIVAREQPTSCPKCGGATFIQDPDVLDTWFSSALWPFSTLGWPRNTPDLQTFYPTSVMETGHDIIFFWVARMMMMGLHFMGDVPFRTVYLHAMVRDEKGEKMSKTKGNVIDPLDVILGASLDKLAPTLKNKFPQGMPAFGADALRFTLASLTQQGRDIKLSMDRLAGYKAFCNKLWNASRFALMNMGEFTLDERPLKARPLTLADRWILSRLQRATTEARASLETYGFAEAASTLYQFLWAEFCDWYIELAKGSLYGTDEQAKDSARAVLVYSLDRILRLLHPFMPFITEEIWQKLPMSRPVDSIMIASYPEPDADLVDEAAEAEMAPVIATIEGLRTLRGESNLSPATKVKAVVQSPDARTRELLERWRAYLMPLAGLSEVEIGAPGTKPPQAAAFVGTNLEIYVPLAGLIDLDAERDRLRKEIARAEQEAAGVLRKLENPNFVAKAPPDVVEKDRARVEELKERKAKLQDHLQRIAPEPAMPAAPPSESSTPTESVEPTEADIATEADVATEPTTPPGSAAPLETTPPVEGGTEYETLAESTEEEEAAVAPAEEKAAPDAEAEGNVDLAEELKDELDAAGGVAEAADPQVQDALEKLRAGTKEGLSPADHHDLGVAYMSMGLVDDAMREFNTARAGGDAREAPAAAQVDAEPEQTVASTAKAVVKAALAAVKKASSIAKDTVVDAVSASDEDEEPAAPAKARPAKKAAGKKARAAATKAPVKATGAKGAVTKAPAKGAAKKAAAKKAPAKGAAKKASTQKAAAKKAPAKGAAKKASTQQAAAKKAPAKAASKKASAQKAAAKKAPAKAASKKASAQKAAAKKASAKGSAKKAATKKGAAKKVAAASKKPVKKAAGRKAPAKKRTGAKPKARAKARR
ncbi:valine--tRNA ligase [Myxococcus sp. AM010]|uniref:valine--tRNA ligase n=1 Tax=Myxococcus sp. AM010 TaxID=2745138 RepID=UPI001594E833|nr:valine--tRNA ligase [Myxococcus sp. AM010]NVJ12857.1 valine--tRNA ligase [Myxococcus sp. AM010]